jgi:hypothetical protein
VAGVVGVFVALALVSSSSPASCRRCRFHHPAHRGAVHEPRALVALPLPFRAVFLFSRLKLLLLLLLLLLLEEVVVVVVIAPLLTPLLLLPAMHRHRRESRGRGGVVVASLLRRRRRVVLVLVAVRGGGGGGGLVIVFVEDALLLLRLRRCCVGDVLVGQVRSEVRGLRRPRRGGGCCGSKRRRWWRRPRARPLPLPRRLRRRHASVSALLLVVALSFEKKNVGSLIVREARRRLRREHYVYSSADRQESSPEAAVKRAACRALYSTSCPGAAKA